MEKFSLQPCLCIKYDQSFGNVSFLLLIPIMVIPFCYIQAITCKSLMCIHPVLWALGMGGFCSAVGWLLPVGFPITLRCQVEGFWRSGQQRWLQVQLHPATFSGGSTGARSLELCLRQQKFLQGELVSSISCLNWESDRQKGTSRPGNLCAAVLLMMRNLFYHDVFCGKGTQSQ